MSDTSAPVAESPALFTPVEIEQFDADDVTAGKRIGQMLALLFLYTVIVMSLVSWWTFSTVAARSDSAETTETASH